MTQLGNGASRVLLGVVTIVSLTIVAPETSAAAASEGPRLPSPVTTLYFAEGYTGPGFQEYLTIQNPVTATASVEITYYTDSGQTIISSRQVPANSRLTVNVNAEVGPGQEVSVKIESDQLIFAERPMYFMYRGGLSGGHVASGQSDLLQTMYFAEGYTGPGFDEYITLQNPGGTPATVDFEYQLGSGAVVTSQHVVAPTSRKTVYVNSEVGPGQEVSAKLTSDAPILAERPMYFAYGGWITDGHVSPAQAAPGTTFYFAEGYTGPGFDEYITLQNPGSVTATVSIDYQSSTGATYSNALAVGPKSRATVRVNNVVGPNKEISAKVTSDQPILAERPMYFSFQGSVTGGSVVAGQPSGLATAYFAEGYTGPGFVEYLTFQNPGGTDARVTVAYQFPGGATAATSLMVPANSRRTLAVGNDLGVGIEVSARVASDQPIVTERPMYFAYQGSMDGGHVGAGQNGPVVPPEPFLSGASRMHHRGIGPIRAGMSMAEAQQLGGFVPSWGTDIYGDGSCLYAYPYGQIAGIGFMVSFGIIVRTDIYMPASSVLTLPGLGLGSTEAAIYSAYPSRVSASPHTYAPDGEYLDVAPAQPTEPGNLIRFSTNAGNVVTFYESGFDAEVRYIEGCV